MRINFAKTLGVLATTGIMLGWVVQLRAQTGVPTCQHCMAAYQPCCPPKNKCCIDLRWFFDCHYASVSPDHGWNSPQKHPILRRGVTYKKYLPNVWYGQQAKQPQQPVRWHPMIATPTDTTQLGYYYQHVPTWQPNPAMVPPPPMPRDWHDRSCPLGSGCQPVIMMTTPQQPTQQAPTTQPPAPNAPQPVPDPAVPPAPQTTAMLAR